MLTGKEIGKTERSFFEMLALRPKEAKKPVLTVVERDDDARLAIEGASDRRVVGGV
jgi:hypothetical protein